MGQSQVISFRASGPFLDWIEAQRIEDESPSQAAQRILKGMSGASTVSTETSTLVDAAVIERIAAIEERLGKVEALSGGSQPLEVNSALREQELIEARASIQTLKKEVERWKRQAEEANAAWKAFEKGREADLEGKIERLKGELAEARERLSAQTAPDSEIVELPAADLLNQLKARRKKSAATLADVEAILEMIGG